MLRVIFWICLGVFLVRDCCAEGWLNKFSPQLAEVEQRRNVLREELEQYANLYIGGFEAEYGSLHAKPASGDSRSILIDLGRVEPIDEIGLFPVRMETDGDSNSHYFPKRFEVEISEDAGFTRPFCVFSWTRMDFANPGIAPVVLQAGGRQARFVRLTTHHPVVYALADIMVISNGCNIAVRSHVVAPDCSRFFPRWELNNLVDGHTPLGPPIVVDYLPYDGLYTGPLENGDLPWMLVDLKHEYEIQDVRLHPVHARMGSDSPGYGFPLRFRVDCSNTADFSEHHALEIHENAHVRSPGNNPHIIPGYNRRARYIRITSFQSSGFIHQGRFGLSEIEVYSGGKNVAKGGDVTTTGDSTAKTNAWPKSLLVDGYTSHGRILPLTEWLHSWNRRRELTQELRIAEADFARLTREATNRMTTVGVAGTTLCLLGSGLFVGFYWRKRKQEIEKFRRQLAHDLHDEIGSSLAAIEVMSRTGMKRPAMGEELLPEIHQIARDTTLAMRETLWLAGFREEADVDFSEQLRNTAARLLVDTEHRWIQRDETFQAAWSMDQRREIFLFFKEVLSNIVRHAHATTVELSATVANGKFELSVTDNGSGFAVGENRGVGLRSLHQRAKQLGGTANIQSEPEKGTRIVLTVPLVK